MKEPFEIRNPRPPVIPRRTSILGARDVLQRALVDMILRHSSARGLVRRVLDVVVELLDADRGTIYAYDEERDELVSVAAHLTEIPTIRVPLSQGVAGYVARVGETVNIPSCDMDSRFWRRVDERTGYRTRCMLTAPVSDQGGRRLGVVQLLNKRGGVFTAVDEETLHVLVGQIATILDRISLADLLRPASALEPEIDVRGGVVEQPSRDATQPPAAERREDVFALEPTLAELEARYISHLLAQHGGNRSRCARLMGIGRNTFHRKMSKYKLK